MLASPLVYLRKLPACYNAKAGCLGPKAHIAVMGFLTTVQAWSGKPTVVFAAGGPAPAF
jgi:hypothetical protein